MPGCIVSATTASFSSVEKRRLRATPLITSTFENVSDIGVFLGLSLGPPASAGVRSKRGALHATKPQQGLRVGGESSRGDSYRGHVSGRSLSSGRAAPTRVQ